jgi:Na+-transporting NADH:ubiquinone oxidoreductase subunit NqrB
VQLETWTKQVIFFFVALVLFSIDMDTSSLRLQIALSFEWICVYIAGYIQILFKFTVPRVREVEMLEKIFNEFIKNQESER